MSRPATFLLSGLLFLSLSSCAQILNHKQGFSRQDSLRGSITPERAWWDAVSYHIGVAPDFNSKTIEGKNEIRFKVVSPGSRMQIDLQEPMKVESAYWKDKNLPLERVGNVYISPSLKPFKKVP